MTSREQLRPSAADALALDLRRVQSGRVRFDPMGRHLYASDASQYRHVPLGVVLPNDVDDLIATVATCRSHGASMTMRGAGTSLAGQACNTGVIVDVSNLDRIIDVDPEAALARVEPGVVLSSLQRAAAPFGLRFGPDPATANRCTLGGMIGNNSCGAHSLRHGRTSDNVHALDVLLVDGTRWRAGAVGDDEDLPGPARAALAVARRNEVALRQRYPSIPRRVSGYNLDDLLGAAHFGRFLVGSEGTLAVTLAAQVRLVEAPGATSLLVLAYPDVVAAAEHAATIATWDPQALEGIDATVAIGASGRGAAGVSLLPGVGAGAWLLVEFGGATPAQARAAADAAASSARDDGLATTVVYDPAAQAALWEVRKAGLGAVSFVPGRPAHVAGWEDAAVEPSRLADYLREFLALVQEHGLSVALYGHFGEGCVHTKLGFDHASRDGIQRYRRFVHQAAELAIAHGGVPSGEHGDGQARGELLERAYGAELLQAHRDVRRAFDPDGLLNPGRLVDALPLDTGLRATGTIAGARQAEGRFETPWPSGADEMAVAAGRCVGMGVCRRVDDAATMCPSYRVTRDEAHTTRGRARLLQEALRPDTDLGGWASAEVAQALDLCLSCKGCTAECPTGVDLPTLKSEFNAHHYGRGGARRPAVHWVTGLVPWWLRLGSVLPGVANAVAASGPGRAVAGRAGITDRRPVPHLPPQTLRAWWRRRGRRAEGSGERGTVLVFADTFTNHLEPAVGRDAVEVLRAAGWNVQVPDGRVCCGRPLMDPGMLRLARRWATRTVTMLDAWLQRSGADHVVVLEPSCAAMLVDEAPRLLADGGAPLSTAAARVAAATRTLGGFLAEHGFTPPRRNGEGATALVQGHCHQHATVGFAGEATLYAAMGLDATVADDGCCGLAGAFGFEAGDKADLAIDIGESRLLPRVRALPPDAVVVADGWSCRTQVAELQAAHRPVHTASLLADVMRHAMRDAPRDG